MLCCELFEIWNIYYVISVLSELVIHFSLSFAWLAYYYFRLASSTSSLSQDLSRMIRDAKVCNFNFCSRDPFKPDYLLKVCFAYKQLGNRLKTANLIIILMLKQDSNFYWIILLIMLVCPFVSLVYLKYKRRLNIKGKHCICPFPTKVSKWFQRDEFKLL